MKEVRLQKNRLYLLPSGSIASVIAVNKTVEKVFIHNYDTSANEAIDLDFARKFFKPMFKIGEVARMLDRSPQTLRKYEREGLIDKARQFKAGEGVIKTIRLYSPDDIADLLEFFADRRGPGRPALHNVGKVDKEKVDRFINARYEKEK